jgi:hypothetical protein
MKYSKKFWEELIAYFPLIRHGPHRKPKNYGGGHIDTKRQDDFVRYLTDIGGR